MKERIKHYLKKIGVFKYYMYIKRKLINDKSQDNKDNISFEKSIKFYGQFINSQSLCFDVGANIGNRTEVFIELGAKVIAIEPQDSCVQILEKKFKNRITIEKVGLGASNTTMEMFIADESTISTFSKEFISKTKENLFKYHNWNKKVLVPITTLNDLIEKYGNPDFCKIDVEGFEPEVLKGLSIPIPKLSFEYAVPELTDNVFQCIEKLNTLSADYKYNYSVGESMNFELSDWKTFNEFYSIIQSKSFIDTRFGDIYAFKN